ncbi:hypothetical protein GUJ74_24165|nr:hypothetical protein [Escherichia coli]
MNLKSPANWWRWVDYAAFRIFVLFCLLILQKSLAFINLYIRKVALCSSINPKADGSCGIWPEFQVINDQRWLFTIVYEKLCLAVKNNNL